ncbi:MAG: radical SAM protein [Bacteroidales bacterium]|nr:radical SAM protein [Bacteroidales bacterium]
MSTILFNDIVFGPIKSRRLGVSLGVNLLPSHGKLCNFNCIYCECGFNEDGRADSRLPQISDVEKALELSLRDHDKTLGKIDTITFSGNGEPTLHPRFADIITSTLLLRDKFAPEAVVSVLTNGSRIGERDVYEALMKVDNAIIKLDSAIDETSKLIDRPNYNYSVERLLNDLEKFRGKYVLQTMFLRGEFRGSLIDNTTQTEVEAWYRFIDESLPAKIMIYTIDRETPADKLIKVSVPEMEIIAAPLIKKGYKVSISG